jgi:hypothetical protein
VETIDCQSWNELKSEVSRIRALHEFAENEHGMQGKRDILYRGLPSAEWELKTTLDRFDDSEWTLGGYLSTVDEIVPHFESHFPRNWQSVGCEEIEKFCQESRLGLKQIPLFPFLVYLRHLGFPSPLLDWTESPWIAAHFSVAGNVSTTRAALHVYCVLSLKEEYESEKGPNVHFVNIDPKSHIRHFSQQSQYTYCTMLHEDGDRYITDHGSAFASLHEEAGVAYKLTFPTSERKLILKELYEYNVNSYTLFQNEEGLASALALKKFTLDWALPQDPPTR